MSKSVSFHKLEIVVENVRGGHIVAVRAHQDSLDEGVIPEGLLNEGSLGGSIAETRRVVAGEPGDAKTNRRLRKALKELLDGAYPVPARSQQKADAPGQTTLAGVD